MTPTRFTTLPAQPALLALTATARGMVGRTMERAARQAFDELMAAVGRAGQMAAVRSAIAVVPDDAAGPDDPNCRYVAGVLFGHELASQQGQCVQPDIALSGSLAWQPLSGGRYAVFSHIGPYGKLHRSWSAIYADWLPASGEQLRDTPPLELMRNDPNQTPAEKLHTEIWIPVV